jgi:hypothetical protein
VRAPAEQLLAIDAALAAHDGTLVVQHFGSWVHGPVAARRARLAAAGGDRGGARIQLEAAVALTGAEPPAAIAVDLAVTQVAIEGRAARDAAAAMARRHDLVCAERVIKALSD